MADPVQDFLFGSRKTQFTPVDEESSLGETFGKGAQAGAEGLLADLDYFAALGNSLVGDKEGVARRIKSARANEAAAADSIQSLQNFEEFIDEPTFSGFMSQVAKGTGQLAPFAITSVLSAGFGAAAGVGTKLVAEGSKLAAKRIVKDSLQKTAKGIATPEEKEIADATWNLAKRARVGGITGAGASEFAPLSGSNFSEAIESGKDPNDPFVAFRAAALGVPQAAIGVGGEVALLKLVGSRAKKLSGGDSNSVMGRLAKDLGTGFVRGGAIEAGTETVQEGLAVLNRAQMDDTFTAQDAQMRLGEAAFAAFFGGGSFGAAGSTAAGGIRELTNVPEGVKTKARELLASGKQTITDNVINNELFRGKNYQYTSPEATSDINAQIEAMFDEDNQKQVVWIEGDSPAFGAAEDGRLGRKEVNGKEAFVAFIPGRGTAISPFADVTQEIVDGQATEAVLAAALGYSSPKPVDSDRVVQVLDAKGRVVSEEATNEAGEAAAKAAAGPLTPKGGSVRTVAADDAVRERDEKVAAESDPVVRDISVAPDGTISRSDRDVEAAAARARQALDDEDAEDFKAIGERLRALARAPENKGNERLQQLNRDFRQGDIDRKREIVAALRAEQEALAQADNTDLEAEMAGAVADPESGVGEQSLQLTGETSYKPAPVNEQGVMREYDGLQEARQNFIEAFEGVYSPNFTDGSYWSRMTPFMLNGLVRLRRAGKEVEIEPPERRDGDSYGVKIFSSEVELFRHKPRNKNADEQLLELGEFLEKEVGLATGSQFARGSGFSITTPDGTTKPVNLVDLTNAGRRLLATRLNQEFTAASDADALLEAINELLANGYKISAKAQGKTKQGRKVTRDVDITATSGQGQSILDALAQYQLRVRRWFLDNSTVDPDDPTQRTLNEGAPDRPLPPAFLQPILNTAVSSEGGKKVTLRAVLSRNLNKTKTAEEIEATRQRERSELEERARVQQGIPDVFEADEDVPQAVERQQAAEEGLIDRPDFIGDESVDRPSAFTKPEDPPYAYYDVSAPTGAERSYGNPITFPFGDPVEVIAKPIRRAASRLNLKLPIGLVTISQLNQLTQGQIRERFGDPRVAEAFIREARDLRARPNNLGRTLTFKNAHFILIDDTKIVNDYEATLVAAHELGHAVFQEELDGLVGKPIFKRMWQSFKARDRSEKAYSGPHGFEEWFADNVAKWVDIQTRKDASQRPANMEESVFKRIAGKLIELYNTMRVEMRRRFRGEVDLAVDSFIQSVIRANASNNVSVSRDAAAVAGSPPFEKKAIVRSIQVQVEQTPGAKGFASALARKVAAGARDAVEAAKPLRHVFFTANKNLRFINSRIADMFYVEAGASGKGSRMGFLQEADVQNREFEVKFEREIGSLDSPEVIAAMEEAATSTPTNELQNDLAKKIRGFFESMHRDYIEPMQAGYAPEKKIQFQANYFPVVLNLQRVANDTEAFKQLILEARNQLNDPVAKDAVNRAVARIVKYQDVVTNSDLAVDEDLDPAAGREQERELTAGIDREVLADFLVPPTEAFRTYKKQLVKRVEWNRSTKTVDGQDRLGPLLDSLDGTQKSDAQNIINSYLGYGYEPMSEGRRKWQSRLLAAQYTLLLPFAAIGSLPELAGPIIFSKEFGGFEMAFRQLKQGISQKEARLLAEDIGLVQDGAVSNAWMSVTEREFMDEASRNWTDGFFKYTGLEWFTNFSRSFATGMGVQFLLRHAKNETGNPRSARYLADLGVTAEQIVAWDEGGRDNTTAEGKAVKFALQKFVESSILRPNAAERPVWASDPRWALVWQLKSYFYAFYTKIIGGIRRETMTRLDEGEGAERIVAASAVLALSAVALMPLAMAGMELREYAKTGAAFFTSFGQSDKNYFRTDDMTWGTYLGEVLDKTGIYGPLSIVSMAYRSGQWNGPAAGLATLLGPSFETAEALVGRGEFDRIVPAAAIL